MSFEVNRKNLGQLINLRFIAAFSALVTIIFGEFLLDLNLPLKPLFAILFLVLLLNFFSLCQSKKTKKISNQRLFFELFFDVFAFAILIYFSGGASNPFISLFLLQVVIAAILLKEIHAFLITSSTIIFYVLLNFHYQHLHAFHHHSGSQGFFNLHVQGMLFAYIIAAILLLIFIGNISKNLRARDEKIHKMSKENALIRNALIATSAAHELSTPLSTIAVVLGEWKNSNLDENLKSDIVLIEKQIARLEKIIDEILENSNRKRLKNS